MAEKRFLQLFLANEHQAVDQLLEENPQVRQQLNERTASCRMPLLAAAKGREMVDVLLRHGASLASVTDWWAAGFGVEQVDPDVARYLVERGANPTIHAAVGIGLAEIVEEMLDREPSLVTAAGGDGCQPLHFCRDRKLAIRLLECGADLDARDDDHNSTPAQWRIGDAPEVVKLLLERGAKADIFMAAGLGDLDLARQLIAEDAGCTAHRIGHNSGPFPGIGFQGRGGTIYQWSLGFNLSPHEVARQRGHHAIYDLLMENSTPPTKFLVACTSANRPMAEALAADHRGIVNQLDDEDYALLPKYCWETNQDIDAVRLMLDMGFPVAAIETNHGYSALHNAAWCGNLDLVRLLLERGHPTDMVDPKYDSTSIGYAVHSCIEAKRHPDGQFAEVVAMLLAHGTPFDPQRYPVGDALIDAVIRKHLEGPDAGAH